MVAKDTTTFKKLKEQSFYYPKVFSVEATDKLDARDRALDALDALEKGQLDDGTPVEAFASDAVIVQAIVWKHAGCSH